MPASQIFISYRRDDSAGYARAVYDELARRFGAERVFMDVDDIGAGTPFADVIRRAVGDSSLLLVLIGKRWRGEQPGGPPRIAEPDDFVRIEVAAALASGVRVIPLLLDGTPMPRASDLPEDLRALAGRNALELDNSRFAADLERLVVALRQGLGEGNAAIRSDHPERSRSRRRAVAAAAALGLGVLALAWWMRGPVPAAPADADRAAKPAAMARPAINGEWQAALEYDWPNARYTERIVLGGEGAALHGTASFLGVPRGLLEGVVEGDGLRFVTRTQQTGDAAELVHRYRAKWAGDELRFVMQTEGGSTPHAPLEFVARRVMRQP